MAHARRLAGVVALVALGMVALLAVPAVGGGGEDSEDVTREVLAQTAPANAPGQEMYLVRVVIPAGAGIPTHYHPGTQLAQVQRGTLTYTIIEGTATVLRGDGDGEPVPEEVTGPATVRLGPKDGVIETSSLVHEAANNGKKPVTILLSALLTAGEPLSIPVEN
jgi:oxalate decarboxylase/phosphoglucose isomerase-like protein (cupin superfamily)